MRVLKALNLPSHTPFIRVAQVFGGGQFIETSGQDKYLTAPGLTNIRIINHS